MTDIKLTVVEDPMTLLVPFEIELKASFDQGTVIFKSLLINYIKESMRTLTFIDEQQRDQLLTDKLDAFVCFYKEKEYHFISEIVAKLQDTILKKKKTVKQVKHLLYKYRCKLSTRDVKDIYQREIGDLCSEIEEGLLHLVKRCQPEDREIIDA
jgi:hypothetical protein